MLVQIQADNLFSQPLEEGAEAAEGVEKPELKGPFGVQDNGEITDATGQVIGKLALGNVCQFS